MDKKCEICGNEMFEDDKGEFFCPDCEAEDFLTSFDEDNDEWLKNKPKVVKPKTKSVTIRMNVYDIDKAKNLAKKKKMPYQTLLKEIIHKNLA